MYVDIRTPTYSTTFVASSRSRRYSIFFWFFFYSYFSFLRTVWHTTQRCIAQIFRICWERRANERPEKKSPAFTYSLPKGLSARTHVQMVKYGRGHRVHIHSIGENWTSNNLYGEYCTCLICEYVRRYRVRVTRNFFFLFQSDARTRAAGEKHRPGAGMVLQFR